MSRKMTLLEAEPRGINTTRHPDPPAGGEGSLVTTHMRLGLNPKKVLIIRHFCLISPSRASSPFDNKIENAHSYLAFVHNKNIESRYGTSARSL